MQIRTYNSRQLSEFINSEEFKTLENLPISKHRAVAHIHNPRVEEEDVLLVCAFEDNGVLVGYMGLLPDVMHFQYTNRRTAWISTIWIHPDTRGKGIANLLLDTAFNAWKGEIAATGFTATAKKLYDKYGKFMDFKMQNGLRAYLRFNLRDLASVKFPKNGLVKALGRVADGILNFFNDLRLTATLDNALENYAIAYLTELDAETATFVERENQNEICRRGPQDLNWIMRYPWVLVTPGPDSDSTRYFFSYSDARFEFLFVKVSEKTTGKVLSFIVFEIRGSKMKIPYAYGAGNLGDGFAAIVKHVMLKRRVAMLTVFNPAIAALVDSGRTAFLYKKPYSRHYIISKNFETDLAQQSALKNWELQDGDSDGAFI